MEEKDCKAADSKARDCKVMVICDREEQYVARLADYLSKREEFPFSLWFFTREHEMLEFMKDTEVFLLLIGEEIYRDVEKLVRAENCFLLSNDKTPAAPNALYRYQSAAGIMMYLYQNCTVQVRLPKGKESGKEPSVIAVRGAMCPEARGIAAMAMAQVLSREGRTLFLNLEGLNSLLPAECYSVFNLTDLFYVYRNHREEFTARLSGMCCTLADVCYLPPLRSLRDWEGIAAGEWREFLTAIWESGMYENVVINLSEECPGVSDIWTDCPKRYEVQLKGHRNAICEEWLRRTAGYLKEETESRILIFTEEEIRDAVAGFARNPGSLYYTGMGRTLSSEGMQKEE